MSVIIFFAFVSVVMFVGLVLSFLTIRHHWFPKAPRAESLSAEKTDSL